MSTRTDRPDSAAWIHRLSPWGLRALALVLLMALVFTAVNVQQFSAQGPQTTWWWWSISWLLDPMASITMATAIVFEGLLADHDRKVGWLTATKWYAGIAVWAMNVWDSVVHVVPSGILLHSVAPGLVVLLAEAAPRVRWHLADIIANHPTPVVHTTPLAVPPPQHTTPDPVPTHPVVIAPRPVAVPDAPRTTPVPTQDHTTPTRGTGITQELLTRARALRDQRAKDNLSCGRRFLVEELGVTDRVARGLVDALRTSEPRLERAS